VADPPRLDADVLRRAARSVEGGVRLVVVAKPRSKKEGVEAGKDGSLVVRVQAPPVEGAANERIVAVLADLLDVRKGDVRFVRGETARHKELEIAGVTLEDVVARLAGPRAS
jgi:uncharacterized protein (TIGR00251 family)